MIARATCRTRWCARYAKFSTAVGLSSAHEPSNGLPALPASVAMVVYPSVSTLGPGRRTSGIGIRPSYPAPPRNNALPFQDIGIRISKLSAESIVPVTLQYSGTASAAATTVVVSRAPASVVPDKAAQLSVVEMPESEPPPHPLSKKTTKTIASNTKQDSPQRPPRHKDSQGGTREAGLVKRLAVALHE